MSQFSETGPIAYMTGSYPMISHTFILREIQALRCLGLTVHPCAARRPDAADFTGPDEIAALDETFYVLAAAKRPLRLAAAHVAVLRRAPRRWLSALKLALRTRPPGTRALAWQIFYFLEAAVLVQHLRARGVRHIHNHFGNSSCSLTMIASEMSGIPYSFTLHGPAIFFEAHWWRLDQKIARARFVACISHFARSQAMLFSDQSHWDRLKIIHCGVTPANYRKAETQAPGPRVLFVGRLAAVKGAPLLLRAFAAQAGHHPGARLAIVGDGPDRAALEAEARALGLADRVDFLGYQPQGAVAQELSRSDMLVLPSFAEGVPVVLMEAMAATLPVIASRVAGVPELVEDGVSGFVTPPGDLATLTDRLGRLLADADLRARMGAAGRAKVVAEFDVGTEAAKLARAFAEAGEGERCAITSS